jgi:uncharacterized protein
MAGERTLITGASTGIGRALADICARERRHLILTARDRPALDAIAIDLASRFGVRVDTIEHDLGAPHAGVALFDRIGALDATVDVLINNAGVGLFGAFTSTDLRAEEQMIQLNVVSLVELTKCCVPSMIARRRGRILNVASTAAFVPGPLMSVYYGTKAFVLSFSEALAEELRDSGITVTALCPGPTATEFQRRAGAGSSKLFRGAVMDAPAVAEAGYRAMMRGDRVVVPGFRNKTVPFAARVLPRRLLAHLSRRASEARSPA